MHSLIQDSDWVRRHQHIFLVGPTGSGKTSLARAFGQKGAATVHGLLRPCRAAVPGLELARRIEINSAMVLPNKELAHRNRSARGDSGLEAAQISVSKTAEMDVIIQKIRPRFGDGTKRAHQRDSMSHLHFHIHSIEKFRPDRLDMDFSELEAPQLSREMALALELWRTRGCPDGGMQETLQQASAIVRSNAWSS